MPRAIALALAAMMVVACGSPASPPATVATPPPPPPLPRDCPPQPEAGACGRDPSPCDYGETRCVCWGSRDGGCPGGQPPPPLMPGEVDVRQWGCFARPHPICDTRSGFEGACGAELEGVRCEYCRDTYTCTDGQWVGVHEPTPV